MKGILKLTLEMLPQTAAFKYQAAKTQVVQRIKIYDQWANLQEVALLGNRTQT